MREADRPGSLTIEDVARLAGVSSRPQLLRPPPSSSAPPPTRAFRPPSARGRLDAGLRLIDAITIEVTHADADLRASFAGDHRVRRLVPIPGVGLVTAATVVAEVWDIGRFPSPERLCSWAGLTPGERTSDAHTRRGHITKQGSRWLRWMLVEAATTAVRDPQLGRFAGQIAQRRGPKIARVALARRLLLTPCYYALRDDGGCRAYPPPRDRSRRRDPGALGSRVGASKNPGAIHGPRPPTPATNQEPTMP